MKFLLSSLGLFVVAFAFLFWLAFFSTRPAATDPATLAGDGSTINYCELPKLDGNGKVAAEIPKGNTPLGCRYAHFPLPILKDCTEPLAEDADDMRGLWLGVSGGHVGHVERVEQCGSRVVVTTLGIIHDFGPNSTAGLTSNDTEGNVWFTIGGQDYCMRSSASLKWEGGKANIYAFDWGPLAVKRYLDGEQLVWEYHDDTVTRMDRICRLPDAHKVPQPRGLGEL